MIESIDNYQNTLPFDVTSDVSQLRTRFNNPDISMTERVAYARAMRNNGSPGVIALEEELVNLTGDSGQWSASTVQANPDTKKDLLTFKEIMREDKGFQTASRSFEVWANNEKVGDGQGGKRDYTSFGEALDRTDVFETVSAQRFASQSENVRVDQLKKLKALPDDTKYKEFIRRIARDSTAMGNIKGTAQDIILESVKQYGMED